MTSGSTITETYDDTTGQAITLTNAGTIAVALDSSSPGIRLINANTTDNTLAVLRFTSANEAVEVKQLGLVLGGTGSNTPQDLVKVTLWDGATKVGESVLTGDNATATLTAFVVPKDADKTLTIKGDLAAIGTSDPARPGHLVRVEYDGANADSAGNATRGTGLSSGSTVYATGATTASSGARIFKAIPKLTKLALPSTKLINANIPLYRFSVTAPSAGTVGLYKFTLDIATSTSGLPSFAITNLQVRGYSDSAFSQAAYSNNGLVNSSSMTLTSGGGTAWEFYFDPVAQGGTNEAIQVPAGTTRYYELTGTVANMSATSSTVSVSLLGDASYTAGSNTIGGDNADSWVGSGAGNYAFATTAALVDGFAVHDDFIWSGNSTTTSGVASYDWVNGFQVDGLPSTNMTSETLTP